ncbi:MAG TPA: diguanylate cyclase [Polyangiales bacterium]|nr:diguanylate cyclase [Polyangiales bacterium]
MSPRNIPVAGTVLALLVVASIGAVGYRTVRSEAETTAWVEHTYQVIQQLDHIVMSINLAESAVRGYALSREEHLRRELQPAIAQARQSYSRAGELTHDNVTQQKGLHDLGPKLDRRIQLLDEYSARVSSGGSTHVLPEALQVSAEIRQLTSELIQREQGLLSLRVAERSEQTARVLRVCAAGFLTSLLLLLAASGLVSREMRSRRRAQRELRNKHAETTQLLQMGELLQSSRNLDEACSVIGQFAPMFFEQQPGSMYLFSATHNALETRSVWGSSSSEPSIFGADDCWALRLGRPHGFDPTTVRTACKHLSEPLPVASLCLPLLAHGEVLGILHIASAGRLSDELRKRGEIVGEQLSMALANLALREKLRNQSIRDPLTGLFNRRYTEETLDRELHRAARTQQSLALLMLDVDHFKRFNDTFGHEAGDQVLREIGKALGSHTRGSDVVSRMGGEELLVVLPGATETAAEQKGEELRAEVAKLRLVHAGRELGEITISIGVAVYPRHGTGAEELMRAADAALYRAKREGRDRVIVAA